MTVHAAHLQKYRPNAERVLYNVTLQHADAETISTLDPCRRYRPTANCVCTIIARVATLGYRQMVCIGQHPFTCWKSTARTRNYAKTHHLLAPESSSLLVCNSLREAQLRAMLRAVYIVRDVISVSRRFFGSLCLVS